MIDFTQCTKRNKAYSGANGNKISVIYDDALYMLKFPSLPTKTDELSYTNSCISEYLGCKIFKMLDIPVQEVELGTYRVNDKVKLVVACKDFALNGLVLQDFASLKNQIIDSERNGYGTELSDVLDTIKKQTFMDVNQLEEHFWNIFIVDALIGNWDRHNGNWGFLYNQMTDEVKLAPVFDCGSSLYPQADEDLMRSILENKGELHHRVYNIPTSALVQHGKKIKYFDFLSSMEYEGCNSAIKRMVPRIDMQRINRLVDDTPYISDLQKEFYKTMLGARKELILDFAYKKVLEQNKIPTPVVKPRRPRL